MFIIRVGCYYTCIVHKQDDISIFGWCLGQIIGIKKKKQLPRVDPCGAPLLTSSQLEYETLLLAVVL